MELGRFLADHLNRVLREKGSGRARGNGPGVAGSGASVAFAVADHQVAHVYVNDRARGEVRI